MIRPLLLALVLFTVPAGAREGREANAHYAEGRFEEAAARYRDGLARSDEDAGAVRSALLNNLGCALYEQGDFAEAQTAFEAALGAALTPEGQARAAYNAGNALAEQQNIEAALGFYRRALLARPDFHEAKFNYELLKRRLQNDPPPDEQPDDPSVEPSPFAEALKAEADSLVAARQYGTAFETMQHGLATDSTVQAYAEFIGRLGAVAEIEDADQP